MAVRHQKAGENHLMLMYESFLGKICQCFLCEMLSLSVGVWLLIYIFIIVLQMSE